MMTANWNVFFAAVAIGAVAELLTLHYPSRYRQAVATGKVIAIATGIALLPEDAGQFALAGLLVARVGDVIGELVHTAVIRLAVWWDGRAWHTPQNPTAVQPEKSTITSEQISTEL